MTTMDDAFCYTVSNTGVIEAFRGSAESREGCSREFYPASAAVRLAKERANEFLKHSTSITEGDRVRRYLGRLNEDAEKVLKEARAAIR